MSHRKKINEKNTEAATVQYQNLFAQINTLVSANKSVLISGRGSAKTTDIQAERLIDIIYDMPGAPIVWVADTFTNLSANILPSLLEGLERKGFREGVHYVVEKEPPVFTDREKSELPDWLRPHFWKPFNKLVSYKRTIIFFTGTNIRFGSLDRPSSLAGSSYVYIFGDEVKYFKEEKISNLLKAVRGYRAEFGNSVYYRGFSFTSDMPDTSHLGEYDWPLKYSSLMNKEAILLVIRAGLVYYQALHEAVAAKDKYMRTGDDADRKKYEMKLATSENWRKRWTELRKLPDAGIFFMKASSYVNADILTAEWFTDAINADMPDFKTSILTLKPSLDSGSRFYVALNDRHFYDDGINENEYDRFELRDMETCAVLWHIDLAKPLNLGVDFGNMCSMTIDQEGVEKGRECIRFIKFLYTLAPDYIPELGEKFRTYFAPMQNKLVYLYADRAGNAYRSVGEDQTSKLKRAIEYDGDKRTGWTVQVMTAAQGTIYQADEYSFMQELLSETNPKLPIVRIDQSAARPLKLSLENARTKIKNGIIHKDKSSEKLPVDKLPFLSTNPSDAFKYRLMNKRLIKIFKNKPGGLVSDPIFSSRS